MNEDANQKGNYDDNRNFHQKKEYNVDDLLTNVITANASRAGVKLRPFITGKILFQITDTNKNYVFDWSGEKATSVLLPKGQEEQNIDCYISVNENTMQKIASGDINPQIAMLSNKMNIKGKVSFAVYAFNLLTDQ